MNQKDVITHLQIIHTWVSYAREKGMLLGEKEITRIEKWTADAIELLKEQEQPTGHWIDYPECLQYDGAFSDDHHVCSKCSAVFNHMDNCMEDWKCCPNCGARMEGTNV
mgnify:CR=1 FL=1